MAVLSKVTLVQALAVVAAAHPQANEKRQQGISVTASETYTFNGGVGVTFPTFVAPSGSLPRPSIPALAPVAQYSAALASLASRLNSATLLTAGPQIPTATIRAEIAALQTQLAQLSNAVHPLGLPAQFASNLALVGAEVAALPTATAPGAIGGQGVTFPGFSFPGFTTTLPTITLPTISTPSITIPTISVPSITAPTLTTPAVPSITLPPQTQLPVYFFQELVFILNQLNAFKTYPASALAGVPTASFNAVFTSLRAELAAASGYPRSLPTTFPSTSYQGVINSLESSIRDASLRLAGATPGPITVPSVTAPTVSVPTPTLTLPTITTPAVPSFTLPPRPQLPTYFFQELVFILNQLNALSSYDPSVLATIPTSSFNAAFTSLRQQLGQASGFPSALPTTFPDQAYQSAVLGLEAAIMSATANLPSPTATPTISIPTVTPPTVTAPSPTLPTLTGACALCSLPTITTTAYVTTVTVSVPVPGTA